MDLNDLWRFIQNAQFLLSRAEFYSIKWLDSSGMLALVGVRGKNLKFNLVLIVPFAVQKC